MVDHEEDGNNTDPWHNPGTYAGVFPASERIQRG